MRGYYRDNRNLVYANSIRMLVEFRITRITDAEKRLAVGDTSPGARTQGRWCNCTNTWRVCALEADARHVKGYNESSCATIITSLAYIRGKHAWIALWHDYCKLPCWRYTVTSWQYTLRRYVTPCVYTIRNYSVLCLLCSYGSQQI